ncbi:MAG: type I-U CRISPR-associated protein Csb2 [Spirochaetaceae bacterium]|nr:type I-U CRISPR-associated protein Csb2 [Spirochaetaceae bacterium]
MTRSLLITVRFHDGRYHGEENGTAHWPPSPGRLFQALVAGAARGSMVPAGDQHALRWLEELPPPEIAAPPALRGAAVPLFVPNNDLDAVGGDPGKVAKIRVDKQWRPHFFDAEQPVLYVWDFDEPAPDAERVCAIALRLYQLGRGIDMAAATGTTMSREEAQAALAAHPGTIRRPAGQGAVTVARQGTLASLIERHRRWRERLMSDEQGMTLFRQPPKALFSHVGYDVSPRRLHFELRRDGAFAPCPLESAAALATGLRKAAASRLQSALPSRSSEIERLIVGRGAGPQDVPRRVRITPLPSIGMGHTDPAIRRVMVEIPMECPLPWRDVEWAFVGLEPCDPATGRTLGGSLVSGDDGVMVRRYARPARVFRSVTAVALSGTERTVARRKGGEHRRNDEARAAFAVAQALRHAGVRAKPESIHVQREPLQQRGARAEVFAGGVRFSRRAMWHVVLRFDTPIERPLPLVIGDGRFCGLGLMEPVTGVEPHARRNAVYGLSIASQQRVTRSDGAALVQALRRALMATARDDSGRVDRLFSGHEDDGRPDQAHPHEHVFLAADADDAADAERISRIIVAAPWADAMRRLPQRRRLELFDDVVHRLRELRAGRLGRFRLRVAPIGVGDPVIGPSRVWKGQTAYLATRNLKRNADPAASVVEDLLVECNRRLLPRPVHVKVLQVSAGPRGGRLRALMEIQFATAVRGPLMLGRDSHTGGGLFHAHVPSAPCDR